MTTTKPFRFSAGTMGGPVSREVHAGICEKLRVRSPRLTHLARAHPETALLRSAHATRTCSYLSITKRPHVVEEISRT